MATITQALATLNPAQLKAVQHPPSIPLQILAGPGSGKTKVLTSRIAYLITTHNILPQSICACTFTNKAANEMRERLKLLLGETTASQIKMGTFHSMCALFLRKFGKHIGLENNFTICDADESKKIVARLLRTRRELMASRSITLKEGTVLSLISQAKSAGRTPQDMLSKLSPSVDRKMTASDEIHRIVAEVYAGYEETLTQNNALDFDGLITRGVQLFSEHPSTAEWCEHIFVDELHLDDLSGYSSQDTNNIQFKLMCHLTAHSRCVTIVGDPDQSIYGWRSAEIENLNKMCLAFPTTEQVFLEDNYRSTSSILAVSLAIVAQDVKRVPKTLRTSYPAGPTPVLSMYPSDQAEANYIAHEIKRVVAWFGGTITWKDCAILLRFNALSRAIETALQQEGIPNRVLGGVKFFERQEVKDLLSYLQLIDNKMYTPAFIRAVNTPTRGIGDKSLEVILNEAARAEVPPFQVVEDICDGKRADSNGIKRKLSSFVACIRKLQKLTDSKASPSELLRHVLDDVRYEDYLRKTQPEWESRWENVQELISFATQTEKEQSGHALRSMEEQEDGTPLRAFLQSSMLATDSQSENHRASTDKVTITTCHGAKGLEWPVVFVPGVEDGVFPFYRSEDDDEERRLLYVACTRAQGLLYLSHSSKRMVGGELSGRQLSQFVSKISRGSQGGALLVDEVPRLQQCMRADVCRVLGRQEPDETTVQNCVKEFERRVTSRTTTRYDTVHIPECLDTTFTSAKSANGLDQRNKTSHLQSSSSGTSYFLLPLSSRPTKPVATTGKCPVLSRPSPKPALSTPFGQHRLLTTSSQRSSVSISTKPTLVPLTSQKHSIPVRTPESITTALNDATPPITPPVASRRLDHAGNAFPAQTAPEIASTKRRLGMGKGGGGYHNKRFKRQAPPT